MSGLRHPNITLFVGVCFLPNSTLPVLVMERLSGSLDSLLETISNIPLPLKRSMLEDVATGLVYLHQHSPQIIHRDLTAKNVLLTMYYTAKITDFGNSRIVDLQPGQLARTMSQLPGTWTYMPPEALEVSSRYGPSLDMFSFGHLALFVALQVCKLYYNADKAIHGTYICAYHICSIRCCGYYLFHARVCVAFIREQHLLIPVAAILREMVD